MTTKRIIASMMMALPLVTVAAAVAGPTDGSRQMVSPTTWKQQEPPKPPPYALTGKPESSPAIPSTRGWRREVQSLGNKVQIDSYRR